MERKIEHNSDLGPYDWLQEIRSRLVANPSDVVEITRNGSNMRVWFDSERLNLGLLNPEDDAPHTLTFRAFCLEAAKINRETKNPAHSGESGFSE